MVGVPTPGDYDRGYCNRLILNKMSKKYRSGFERLQDLYTEPDDRYGRALETVKAHFTGFDDYGNYYDMTPAQRHQIRRYYNLWAEYTEGEPVYLMTSDELPPEFQSPKGVETVMRAVQMPRGRKRSKYLYVKYDGENIPTIKAKTFDVPKTKNAPLGRQIVPVVVNEKMGYGRETIEIPRDALAMDAKGAVLSTADITQGARFFSILNGRHEFGRYATLSLLAEEIQKLQTDYPRGTVDDHTRWLFGFSAYYSDSMSSAKIINHIRESKDAFRKRVKREQAKIKRARKRGK